MVLTLTLYKEFQWLCWFPVAAVTDCYKFSGLKHTNLLSYSFGGEKSGNEFHLAKNQGVRKAGWFPLEALEPLLALSGF